MGTIDQANVEQNSACTLALTLTHTNETAIIRCDVEGNKGPGLGTYISSGHLCRKCVVKQRQRVLL